VGRWNLGGLVKIQLVVGVALLAVAAVDPAHAAPAYNWSGCYLGLEGGVNWGNSQFYYEYNAFPKAVGLAETNGVKPSGGLFGGTVGCSYQLSNWVLGIENDISWTNEMGTAKGTPPFNPFFTYQTKETWLDTLRGRLGFAWDHWFVYGTGGAAFANEGTLICGPVPGCGSQSKSVIGWTAGAGVEYAFWGAWSLKLEFLHVDFGRRSIPNLPASNPGFSLVPHDVTMIDYIVRGGVNYKFNLFGPFFNGN
jgi:outer membrane immunogenic protein